MDVGDPPLLAFDTATELLVAALSAPGGRWLVCAPGGAAASALLLPQLKGLLVQASLQWSDLRAIAFGQGPGAFTGLRTSCAVAQGLGLGLGLPLLAIDSLQVVAEDARSQWVAARGKPAQAFDIGVVMDARMDEIYAARYRWQAGNKSHDQGSADEQGASQVQGAWQVQDDAALYTLPALLAAWRDRPLQVLAGSALKVFGPRLALAPEALRFEHEADRAAALLRLALQAFASGQGVDAAAALPLYLRDKVAQTTEERALAQALKADALAQAVKAGSL